MNPLVRLVFFNPIMHHNVWALRRYVRRVSKMVGENKSIVDIGAGECQYRPFFSHAKYVSTDWCGTTDHHQYSAGIDFICSADNLPFDNATFDYVLCTQVLEHVTKPIDSFREISRILKPDGLLFLTVPQTWEEHEQPYDFYRYTQFALKDLAKEHDLEIVEIKPQGGRFLVIGYFLSWSIPFVLKGWFGKPGFLIGVTLFYPLNFLIALFFFLIDPLDRKRELTLNYDCIFKRKNSIP
jgi:SAM-dependent methyltransferase